MAGGEWAPKARTGKEAEAHDRNAVVLGSCCCCWPCWVLRVGELRLTRGTRHVARWTPTSSLSAGTNRTPFLAAGRRHSPVQRGVPGGLQHGAAGGTEQRAGAALGSFVHTALCFHPLQSHLRCCVLLVHPPGGLFHRTVAMYAARDACPPHAPVPNRQVYSVPPPALLSTGPPGGGAGAGGGGGQPGGAQQGAARRGGGSGGRRGGGTWSSCALLVSCILVTDNQMACARARATGLTGQQLPSATSYGHVVRQDVRASVLLLLLAEACHEADPSCRHHASPTHCPTHTLTSTWQTVCPSNAFAYTLRPLAPPLPLSVAYCTFRSSLPIQTSCVVPP